MSAMSGHQGRAEDAESREQPLCLLGQQAPQYLGVISSGWSLFVPLHTEDLMLTNAQRREKVGRVLLALALSLREQAHFTCVPPCFQQLSLKLTKLCARLSHQCRGCCRGRGRRGACSRGSYSPGGPAAVGSRQQAYRKMHEQDNIRSECDSECEQAAR